MTGRCMSVGYYRTSMSTSASIRHKINPHVNRHSHMPESVPSASLEVILRGLPPQTELVSSHLIPHLRNLFHLPSTSSQFTIWLIVGRFTPFWELRQAIFTGTFNIGRSTCAGSPSFFLASWFNISYEKACFYKNARCNADIEAKELVAEFT